jgi:hypothetical protein
MLVLDILKLQVAVVNQDTATIKAALTTLGDREASGHTRFG